MHFPTVLAVVAMSHPIFATHNRLQAKVQAEDDPCAIPHIFCLRGTAEQPGPTGCGVIGDMATRLAGVVIEGVDYPAAGITIDPWTVSLPKYKASETIGIQNLALAMQNFYAKCNNTPTALIGYSQGAQIVGDVLCGRSSGGFDPTPPIGSEYTASVQAVLQLGDPTNLQNEFIPWHKGNGSDKFPGMFPRSFTGFDTCKPFGDRWQSWCDENDAGKNDIFCGNAFRLFFGGDLQIHLHYPENHADEILAWLAEKLNTTVKDDVDKLDRTLNFELK